MSYVYCGWLDSALKWILNNIISPVFNCIKSVLSSVFSFIYSNVLGPILDNTIYAIGRKIWQLFLDMFFEALYSSAKSVLQILDCLADLFDTLLGVQPVIFKGEETTLLRAFLSMDAVRRAFWYINFFALGLAVIFAIYGVTRSVLDFDFENKRPVSRVMSSLLSSVLNLFTVQLAVFGIIYLAEAILTGLNSAMALAGGTTGNTTLGRMIFVLGTLNAAKDPKFNLSYEGAQSGTVQVGPTDIIRRQFFESSGKNPYKLSDVKEVFDIYKLDYVVLIVIGGVFAFLLLLALVAVVRRLFNLLLLYIVSPLFAATIPLDDGEHFGKWRNLFVGTCFTGYGMLVAMKLYLLICPTIMGSQLTMSSSRELDFVCRVVFLLGGLWAVYKSSTMVTGLISGEAASAESESMGAAYGLASWVYSTMRENAIGKAEENRKRAEEQKEKQGQAGEGSQRFNGKNTGAAGTGDHGKDNAFQGDMRNRNDKLEGAGKKDDKNKNSSLFSGKAKPGKSSKLGAQNRTLDKLRKQFDMDNADDLDQENQSEAGLGKNKNAFQERKGRRTTDSAGIGAKKMDAMRAKLGLDAGTKAANAANTQTESEDKNVLNEQNKAGKSGGKKAQDDSGVFGKHPELEKLDDAAGFGSKGKDDTGLKLNSRPKLDDIVGGAAAANAPAQGLHQNLQQDTTKEQQTEPGTDNKFGKSQQAATGKTSPYAATSEARGAYTVGEGGKAAFDMDATSKPLEGEAGKLNSEAAKAASQGAFKADSLEMTSNAAKGDAFGGNKATKSSGATDTREIGVNTDVLEGGGDNKFGGNHAANNIKDNGVDANVLEGGNNPSQGNNMPGAEGLKNMDAGTKDVPGSMSSNTNTGMGSFGAGGNRFGGSQTSKTIDVSVNTEGFEGSDSLSQGNNMPGEGPKSMNTGANGVPGSTSSKIDAGTGSFGAGGNKFGGSQTSKTVDAGVNTDAFEGDNNLSQGNNMPGEGSKSMNTGTNGVPESTSSKIDAGAGSFGAGGNRFGGSQTSKTVDVSVNTEGFEGSDSLSQDNNMPGAEGLKNVNMGTNGVFSAGNPSPVSDGVRMGSNYQTNEASNLKGQAFEQGVHNQQSQTFEQDQGITTDGISSQKGGAGVTPATGVEGGAFNTNDVPVSNGPSPASNTIGGGNGIHREIDISNPDLTGGQSYAPDSKGVKTSNTNAGEVGMGSNYQTNEAPNLKGQAFGQVEGGQQSSTGTQSYSGRQTASTGTQTQEGGMSYAWDDNDYASSRASAYRSGVLNGSTRASNGPTIMNNEMSNGQGFSRNIAENSIHQTIGGQTTQTSQTTQTTQTNRTSTMNNDVSRIQTENTNTVETNMSSSQTIFTGGSNNIHQSVNGEVGTGSGSYARDDTGFNYGNSGLNAYRNSSGFDSIDNPSTGSQYTYTQTVRTGVQQNAEFEKSESPVEREVSEVSSDTKEVHERAQKETKDKNDGNKDQGKR